jgi:peptide/nickel transport system substrate-binding protein
VQRLQGVINVDKIRWNYAASLQAMNLCDPTPPDTVANNHPKRMGKLDVTISVVRGGNNNMQVRHKLRVLVTIGSAAAALSLGLVGLTSGGAGAASKPSGVLTFAEAPNTPPNYIFPYVPCANFSVATIDGFQQQMFRPAYWFGLGSSAAIQPSLSLANQPVFSNGNKTATITMKGWKFADGQTIDAESLMFFLNMYRSDPTAYCGFNGKYGIPNQVASASGTGNTVTIHFTTSVNPYWILYNYLAELTPLPNSWDVTGPGKTSTCATGVYNAKSTNAACLAVATYLQKLAGDTSTYTDSFWQSGDSGPWKLTAFDNLGNATFVPNTKYSGPQKAQVAEVKEVAFTSATAEENALRAGSIDIGYVDNGVLTQNGTPSKPGANWAPIASNYTLHVSAPWSVDYSAYNMNKLNPQAPLLDQLYIRQALQLTVNQPEIIKKAFKGYGYVQINPLPPVTPSSIDTGVSFKNPYPYNPTKASSLLKSHGWVKSGSTLVCNSPGTGMSDCGAGITKGEKLLFTFEYDSGSPATALQVDAEVSEWASIGIGMTVSSAPFNTVISTCSADSAKWSICYWGAGWIYSPEYYPSGETLFTPGASFNIGNFNDPALNAATQQTDFGTASLGNFANIAAQALPDLYQPNTTNDFAAGGIGEVKNGLKSSIGFSPNPLETFMPEYYSFG